MAEDKGLRRLRDQIDEADRKLLDALGTRMKLAVEVGEYKEENGLDVSDSTREKEVISTRTSWGANRGLSSSFVRDLFERIIKHAKEVQKK